MLNRILLTIALSLFFFQLSFSIIYSNIIVKISQQYSEKNKTYFYASIQNQDLELRYVNKYAYTK